MQRNTFVSYRELLNLAARRCRLAEQALVRIAGNSDTPAAALVREIARTEQQFIEGLLTFAREGPHEILATRMQYTLDMPDNQQPETLDAALIMLLQTNEKLQGILMQQTEKIQAAETLNDVRGLTGKLEAVNRSISMIRISAEDILSMSGRP